ncbi:SDR family NAD(P)-dependent oxidoreductase [Sphingomonas oryzagri]
MRSLEGRQIVVTGAAGGIGSLVAAALRRNGAHVIGIDRVACPSCHASLEGDLSTEDGIAGIASALETSGCDTLVNLAGVQYFGRFADQAAASLWSGYVVNLLAPALLTRAIIPGMIEKGAGHIVNIGSVLGLIPFAHFASYSSAKAGLKGLSDALRRELAVTPITVTHISPRAVRTKLATPEILRYAKLTGMRLDAPDKVANRIVQAIDGRERDVVIGLPENLFVRLNALAPRVMDSALAANDRKAASLFS